MKFFILCLLMLAIINFCKNQELIQNNNEEQTLGSRRVIKNNGFYAENNDESLYFKNILLNVSQHLIQKSKAKVNELKSNNKTSEAEPIEKLEIRIASLVEDLKEIKAQNKVKSLENRIMKEEIRLYHLIFVKRALNYRNIKI